MAGQTGRSLRLSAQGIEKANTALLKFGSKADLAAQLQMSRTTINKFFKGETVDQKKFRAICKKLKLILEEVADLPKTVESEPVEQNQDNNGDIDELVRQVRSRAYEKIKTVHGTMRMLRVNRRVPVDDIYIELNVLEQVSCDRTFSDWRRDFQPDWRSFDRLGLGRAIEEGVPALDMVRKYPKLMVFGKPGSGKTTFLKSVALQCIEPEEQLQWDRQGYVPIFITLQKFAKDASKRGKFSLFDYIYHQEFCSWGEKNQQVVESILEKGRGLVLLDGLDEVQGQEYKPVIEEVESFCEYFHSNRFLITCRTQNQRYKYEGFTDVEVADFKPEQVNRFIKRWFAVVVANDESESLATELIWQLQQPENKQIAELAVMPVLLNLICFVFQNERGKLPKNRADLYKKGLRDLLEGLDDSKGVQREPIYEKLTPESKEDLLAYLAATLFEANDYFPEQETLENLIVEHFQISRSKANKVLKSLEEQSGLIVERSEGFWSFSHLTFQEYFTAKWFCDHDNWKGLASHVRKKYWREVFLLAASMMQPANELAKELKKEVDAITAKDKSLQQLLTKVNHKSNSVIANYKSAAIRAFYFDLALIRIVHIDSLDENLDSGWFYAAGSDFVTVLGLGFDLAYFFDKNLAVCFDFGFISLDRTQSSAGDVFKFAELTLENELGIDFALKTAWIISCSFGLDYANHLNNTDLGKAFCVLVKALALAIERTDDKKLKLSLQELQMQLPNNKKNGNEIREWYRVKGQGWAEQLSVAMMTHREMDFTWQYDQQRVLLRQYYDANQLLVDCLNSSCNVTDEVKKEIEETLLLPIDEINKRQQQRQVANVTDE
ncbi:NACHT domain-containing protein [Trichocoleus sp. ST-U3]